MPKQTQSHPRYSAPVPLAAVSAHYSHPQAPRLQVPSSRQVPSVHVNYYLQSQQHLSSSAMSHQQHNAQQHQAPHSGAPQHLAHPSYDVYGNAAVAPGSTASTGSSGSGVGVPGAGLQPLPHRASSGAWTPADDHQLLEARVQGLNWAQIQSKHFPGKSANACRKRHERLMERRGADVWDQRKTEKLAKEYMEMRKEIWQGLAQKTGEKWSVVEQKVRHTPLCFLEILLPLARPWDARREGSNTEPGSSVSTADSRTFKPQPARPPAASAWIVADLLSRL